ncbi:hypothetical protein [Poriferisphaera corsica]|uniref:hypothetical protein n=1 Tax=Poriferisphaera corsica TaxID=2528020 RepID=UPI0011A10EAF|nr:hypothetical protein [Poriferisphaera corsica]
MTAKIQRKHHVITRASSSYSKKVVAAAAGSTELRFLGCCNLTGSRWQRMKVPQDYQKIRYPE